MISEYNMRPASIAGWLVESLVAVVDEELFQGIQLERLTASNSSA